MGESSLDTPKSENKMGDSGENAVSALQLSVSFGRFENDFLSWEKWSTFPTNKYLDEVEKCSTPGSVAQKKAYFEAHYKKIAACKAEQQQDQDKKGYEVSDPVNSEEQDRAGRVSVDDLNMVEEEKEANELEVVNSVDGEVTTSASELGGSQIDEPKDNADVSNEREDSVQLLEDDESCCRFDGTELHESEGPVMVKEEGINTRSELGHYRIGEPNSDVSIAKGSKDSLPSIQDVKDESDGITNGQHLHKSEEAILVKDESPVVGTQELVEPPKSAVLSREVAPKDVVAKVKLGNSTRSQKANVAKIGTIVTSAKNKPVSSTPKSLLISTPKSLKPALSKSVRSESKALSKRDNSIYPLTDKKSATRVESKRRVPTSLHMSLSLDPANSSSTLGSVSRKSLIMERMGDKDIVKRAFQKNYNQLSSSDMGKSVVTSQGSVKDKESKGPIVGTLLKPSIGMIKPVKKEGPRVGQPGLRKASVSPGLTNPDQINGKFVSSPSGLRSHDKPEKPKQVLKKLEVKSNVKANEKPQLLPKAKSLVVVTCDSVGERSGEQKAAKEK